MWSEFKKFAIKGNVVDLAIAVVIGVAFGAVVSSLVSDIIMPPLGVLLQGVEFTQLNYTIQEAVIQDAKVIKEPVVIRYGAFIQTLLDFIIIAFAIFMVIRGYNRLQRKRKEEEKTPVEEPKGPTSEQLLTEIRDLLKNS